VRVNFNYFISEAVFSYIVEAVKLVASDGWRLLGDYRFDPATGLWRHHRGPVEPPMRLSQVGYDADGKLRYPRHDHTAPESALEDYLTEARELLSTCQEHSPETEGHVNSDFDHLRWFDLPSRCLTHD
jgi:hypothetical protein